LFQPGDDTIGFAMNPENPALATYMARRPLGAWRTNGPPIGSAVVCGCGRPATVPLDALPGVVTSASQECHDHFACPVQECAGCGYG
jgi:hypothetical protein